MPEAVSMVAEAERAAPGNVYVTLGRGYIAYFKYDYSEAMRLSAVAIEAARAAGDKVAESYALCSQADALMLLGNRDDSLAAANVALEVACAAGDKITESYALHSQADALLMLGRNEEALTAATGAAEAARAAGDKVAESYALRTQADALRMVNRYEESLAAANGAAEAARAAETKLAETNALRTQAEALRMLGRYEEALAAATGALEAARAAGNKLTESNALNSQAEALRMLGRYDEALAAATNALEAARATGNKLTETNALRVQVLVMSQLGLSADRDKVLARLAGLDPSLAQRLARVPLRPGWDPLVRRIIKAKAEREAEFNRILKQDPQPLALPDGFLGKFVVLRKWASYTTVDLMRDAPGAGGADTGTCGGGYFLWWDGWGLVIDPGLGFGKAFRSAGLVPRHVSAVVATHHHIDHTGDMLPVLTCIFEMNPGAMPAHQVDFVLSPGAFGAFAGVAAYVPGVRSVQLLRPNESINLNCGPNPVALQGVKAVHRDLTGRDDASIGLRINISSQDGTAVCSIGFSGDTRLVKESAELYKDVDLMVVHIGSIYEYDVGEGKEPWHLGFAGAVTLLEEIKKRSRPDWDPLVLVSEWGEELGPDRTKICEAIISAVELRVFPAELLQSVGLKPNRAEALCTAKDGKIADRWHTGTSGDIEYWCDGHDSLPKRNEASP